MPKTFPCADYCPKQCAAMRTDQPCLFSGYCKAQEDTPPGGHPALAPEHDRAHEQRS